MRLFVGGWVEIWLMLIQGGLVVVVIVCALK